MEGEGQDHGLRLRVAQLHPLASGAVAVERGDMEGTHRQCQARGTLQRVPVPPRRRGVSAQYRGVAHAACCFRADPVWYARADLLQARAANHTAIPVCCVARRERASIAFWIDCASVNVPWLIRVYHGFVTAQLRDYHYQAASIRWANQTIRTHHAGSYGCFCSIMPHLRGTAMY